MSENTIDLDEHRVFTNTPYPTIDLRESINHYDTLYVNADAYRIVYVSVGGKKYLLSDLIKAYDAVHKKKCKIRKGRKR
jgi:hypothetical protein